MFDQFSVARLMPSLVAWLERWKYLVFIAAAAITFLGAAGMRHVIHDPDVLVYFSRAMPERQDLDTIETRFGRTNEIVFVLRDTERQPMLTGQRLEAIAWLHARAGRLPKAIAVRSPLSIASNGAKPLNTPESSVLRSAIAEAGYSARSVLSEDETVAAVAIVYPRSSQVDIDIDAVSSAARTLQQDFRQRFGDIEILATGRLMMDRAFLIDSQDEIYGYAALQVSVLALILLITFRSFYASTTLMILVLIVGPATIGSVGWAGISLNGISSAAATVLIGLTVATGVHIVLAWQRAMADGMDRIGAVTAALTVNAAPVTLSIVTTILSFLCLNFAASPPFGQLGNVVSFGLVIVLILSFTLLPALLLILPPNAGHESLKLGPLMGRLASFVIRRSRAMMTAFILCIAGSVAGIAQITFDDTFSHYFDERFEVRRATDLFEEKLSGTIFIDFSVPVVDVGGPFGRAHLERLDRFLSWLRTRPEFAEAVSLGTVALRLAGQVPGMLDERGFPENVSGQEALRAAYNQMREDGLIGLVDPAEQHARINIVLKGVSSAQTLAFTRDAKDQAAAIFGAPVIATGLPILSAQLSIDSTRTMFFSMLVALIGVSLLILLALRNVRLGVISLLPNILPAVAAMGVWGLFVGEVSFAATIVGALTFGIVVDDTVHLMMKYQAARREGLAPQRAIEETIRSVGVAVVVTSLALALSFAVFAFSGFLINQHLGLLTGLTLIIAVIADLFFLPPLILQAEKDRVAAEARRPARVG